MWFPENSPEESSTAGNILQYGMTTIYAKPTANITTGEKNLNPIKIRKNTGLPTISTSFQCSAKALAGKIRMEMKTKQMQF